MINRKPFRIFTIVAFIAFLVPMGIQDGMFMDGLIYACVSKNLAHDFGTFWFPKFSQTFLANYHEQLPLFFGIQSMFFRVLGDSLYVERFFALLTACVTACFIILTWRLLFKTNEKIRSVEWLPVLIWITIPTCFWAYINNVEETLMAVFATASIYWQLKALEDGKFRIGFLLLSGFAIFCCSFCKGFQGLFPLVGVFFYWLLIERIAFRRMIVGSLFVVVVPVMLYVLLLLYATSHQSLMAFFNNRLVRTFTQDWAATTTNRFYIIGKLLSELIPSMVFLIVGVFASRVKTLRSAFTSHFRFCSFFIVVGLSGSLPLIVTLEQRSFYLVTTFPFFAMAMALLVEPFLQPILNRFSEGKMLMRITVAGYVLLLAVVVASLFQIGKAKRDREMLEDVYAVRKLVPPGSIVSVPEYFKDEWSLVAYFVRYGDISLDPYSVNHEFLLTESGTAELPINFTKVNLPLLRYNLWRRNLDVAK